MNCELKRNHFLRERKNSVLTLYYTKLATGENTVSPPNMVCVIALPCKILTLTLATSVQKNLYFRLDSCQ